MSPNRNGKTFDQPSETPEEIVYLIGNIANRPDIRAVQERQVREIKTLIAKEHPKKEKDVLDMTPEEVKEWEKEQDNSDDIYKIVARVKNHARSKSATLTPVGDALCNTYTHVIKSFYDFANSLTDKNDKIRLIELIRKNETMPGDFIMAVTPTKPKSGK